MTYQELCSKRSREVGLQLWVVNFDGIEQTFWVTGPYRVAKLGPTGDYFDKREGWFVHLVHKTSCHPLVHAYLTEHAPLYTTEEAAAVEAGRRNKAIAEVTP